MPRALPLDPDDRSAWNDDRSRAGRDTDDPIGEMFSVAGLAGIDPPPMEWIVEELVPVGAVTTFFGDGGLGKTLIAMQMGLAIERGLPIYGFSTKSAPVLGFFCEDRKDELDRRFKAICNAERINVSDVRTFLYQSRFGLESLLGSFADEGQFKPSRFLDAVRQRSIEAGARLVILDNIMHLFGGNVNDPGEVTRFMAALNRLALDIAGAVLLIGHVAKVTGSQFLGTMAWSNASRSRLLLGRPLDADGKEHVSSINRDARILSRLKANYAPIGEPIDLLWHRGAFVRREDIPPNLAAEIDAAARDAAENERFLECLEKATDEQRNTSPNSSASNFAPRVFAQMPIARGMSEQSLTEAMNRLLHLNVIKGDQQLWKRANRSWVSGLARAPTLAPTPHQACTDHAQTLE